MKKQQILGSLFSLLGGALWGISGTIGQFLFSTKGLSALWLTPIRLLLSGVILLGWFFFRSPRIAVAPWKTKRDRLDLLVYGILGISCCQMLYFGTIQLSTAGVATILQDLSPAMILVCACVLAKRRAKSSEIFSIVLALAGVALIVTHGNFSDLAVSPMAILTGVLCACAVTVYNVYPKHLLATYPVPLLQGWSFLIGGTLFVFVFRPWTYQVTLDYQSILGIIGVIVIGNLLAFNLYMKGVAMIGPAKASLYGFAEPVMAAVLSFVWMGSPFTLWDAVGFVCVFLMLVLISLGQLRSGKRV